ncbi:unnamed protein product [Amoebophrya sp. A120]|nr:unnamed protein product [Amoebophrya sp. A120]|eukprot:GSA120T00016538001.1
MCPNLTPASASSSSTGGSPSASAAKPLSPPEPTEIFCHLPLPNGTFYTRKVNIIDYGMTFAMVKRHFLQDAQIAHPEILGSSQKWQFFTDQNFCIPDVNPIGMFCPLPLVENGNSNTTRRGKKIEEDEKRFAKHEYYKIAETAPDFHDDFFLKPATENSENSLSKGNELSYYYAHGTKADSSSSQNSTTARAPLELSQTASKGTSATHNKRQSPFGTNIELYETITKYSFEDHNNTTVKVFVPLDNVGKLDASKVESRFGERSFELLVHGYQGKNWRLGCAKTHEFINVEKSRHAIRNNKVTLYLHKAYPLHISIWVWRKADVIESVMILH